jgi:hypothetical protein
MRTTAVAHALSPAARTNWTLPLKHHQETNDEASQDLRTHPPGWVRVFQLCRTKGKMTRSTASGTSLGTAGVPVPTAPQTSRFSSSSSSRGRGVGEVANRDSRAASYQSVTATTSRIGGQFCCAARDNRSSNDAREVCTVIRPRRRHCSFLMLPPLLVLRRPFFLRVRGRRRCFGFRHDDANARKLSLLTVERNRFLLAFEAPMHVCFCLVG